MTPGSELRDNKSDEKKEKKTEKKARGSKKYSNRFCGGKSTYIKSYFLKLKKKHISRTKIRIKRILSSISLSDLASISPRVVRTR